MKIRGDFVFEPVLYVFHLKRPVTVCALAGALAKLRPTRICSSAHITQAHDFERTVRCRELLHASPGMTLGCCSGLTVIPLRLARIMVMARNDSYDIRRFPSLLSGAFFLVSAGGDSGDPLVPLGWACASVYHSQRSMPAGVGRRGDPRGGSGRGGGGVPADCTQRSNGLRGPGGECRLKRASVGARACNRPAPGANPQRVFVAFLAVAMRTSCFRLRRGGRSRESAKTSSSSAATNPKSTVKINCNVVGASTGASILVQT